ncbi:hypothetical protein PK98_15005 [Croceibacterium mercuriale]|uniref:Uncharacterized protein n=1 Tax=Croceibacterium mercuriale TaxID=1572751 RepID=A0A0B2BWD8_9SPHN|nr:hypothetical protein [Croceibacterium mercuriale]KHL24272.1 hypothetical protein PK98_15005 [Croceibacterium mercuriale]
MKRASLSTLFRDTMDDLHPSADHEIEALRCRWARGELRERKISPEQLQVLTQTSQAWATQAFRDLERSGFCGHNYRYFEWRDPSRAETAIALDVLAGVEIAVLLRAETTDLSKIQSELDHRHAEIVRAAEAGTALPVTLALQRYFTTLVVSLGSQELMSKYAGLNKVSVCYAWTHHLQPSDIDDLADWIVLMPEVIAARDPRKTARLCQAIKCLPFGAQLPDLAAA